MKTIIIALLLVAMPIAAVAADIELRDAFARATPAGARAGAAYMTIVNHSGRQDRLTGGSSPVAQSVQIHQMAVVGGIMRMSEVEGGLAVPAHETVELKPGGFHVMLLGLRKPLQAGDTFLLSLEFARAGKVSLQVPVQAIGQR